MVLNLAYIKRNETYVLEEEVDLSNFLSSSDNVIRKLFPCFVKLSASKYDELLHIDLVIKGKAILICSRSLEDIDFKINTKESLDFTSDEDFVSEDVYLETGMKIDLDPYIFGAIISDIPTNPIKKGAKLPENGKNYEFLTEDEYNKRKKEEHSSPFDCLKDIDL